MLEVNDFNAIRISLASPDQILNWSHGEVTKPETINYRTLRPERDGLFCERIFGPTKDWECYCGKYKRVRFKGIICDKCGVEVARSKVRRERMGHIRLAAPVSHIWFVKGTPSRLGLLLDVSPRNLERVLYFAAYIVTDVDREAVAALTETVKADYEKRIADLEAGAQGRIGELRTNLQSDVNNMTSSVAAQRASLDDELKARLAEFDVQARDLLTRANSLRNESATEDLALGDRMIAREGEMVNDFKLNELNEVISEERERIEREIRRQQESMTMLVDSERDQQSYVRQQEISQIEGATAKEIADLRNELEDRLEELEAIEPLQLLTEGRYRELKERLGASFKAGMGAEAVYAIIKEIDLDKMASDLRAEVQVLSGLRKKKATKRLRVVEAFRKSGNRPEWMIFTVLPVIPPDLRPMVQLDGGRFATSDLNDLYRRVINRNNRLLRLKELGAPEIIIRNEKRMLQEAVDALIDNGRRGRVVSGSGKHKLKSLSDMLKGKQGRFRQNLLGKRVDYSGRSVIVVGPDLQLHQCGLPKKMALELFKPFVMRKLVEKGYAHNIKSAKRIVERVKPEVWDVLEEVIKDYLVLLNRAPTLHRLGIQAFEAKLVEGLAIQLHPLVCHAFNADFDGDQMAVHVPLSRAAQDEARERMLSVYNLLRPSNGEPVITPTQDIVLGCYYLTTVRPGSNGEGKIFGSFEEAYLAYEMGVIMSALPEDRPLHIEAPIRVVPPAYLNDAVEIAQRKRWNAGKAQWIKDNPDEELPDELQGEFVWDHLYDTSVGRILFIQELPIKLQQYYIREHNDWLGKARLADVMSECFRVYGSLKTAGVADKVKRLGFRHSTRGGLSIAVSDVQIPPEKADLLLDADKRVDDIQRQFRRGLLTEDERYKQTVKVWDDTRDKMKGVVQASMNPFGPLSMMIVSGAKGNITQVSQMAGMRGLMADPSGKVIELPIRSNFREGLTVLEYFISTHGARKGLADTALRTADSGYLTRRLCDVAQDVTITIEDCGTEQGIMLKKTDAMTEGRVAEDFHKRITGRVTAAPVVHPETGELLVDVTVEVDEAKARLLKAAGIEQLYVRSPLACQAEHGICRYCYGRNLAIGKVVEIGEAVGIIAAQSIGEPGTQLTMRTFHTGGVAGADITSGLPRVEELFEARVPKVQAILSEIDGQVEIVQEGDIRKIKVVSVEVYNDTHDIPDNFDIVARDGDDVTEGQIIARSNLTGTDETRTARLAGKLSVNLATRQVVIRAEERDERSYNARHDANLMVTGGDMVTAGQPLTSGASNPQEILRIQGTEAVQRYIIDEVQRVYRSQGVATNEKHMEVIVRQMLRKVMIDTQGDTDLLSGELVDRLAYEEINARVLAEGGEPATAQTVLLGVTKASLKTESFLSAASFQETTRVLTEAAIQGSIDRLRGLKENVIIGKLIPAGSGVQRTKSGRVKARIDLNKLLSLDPDDEVGTKLLEDEAEERAQAEMEQEAEAALAKTVVLRPQLALVGAGRSDNTGGNGVVSVLTPTTRITPVSGDGISLSRLTAALDGTVSEIELDDDPMLDDEDEALDAEDIADGDGMTIIDTNDLP